MDSALEWHEARALLEWYVELGVVDAVGDEAVDRYALEQKRAVAKPVEAPVVEAVAEADPVAEAEALARGAGSLEALAGAVRGFDRLDLKRGARNFVFADGNPEARVMIVGEAPGADEDRIGRPFVGRTCCRGVRRATARRKRRRWR